uniref:IS5/IS1182 family transposase n=1 Tax=Globodera pallida TaxID=36090 RepID=A0A183CPS8_GLOPA
GNRRLNGSNTKAEISKVFLMLLVMRLAVRRILVEMAD